MIHCSYCQALLPSPWCSDLCPECLNEENEYFRNLDEIENNT